MLKTSLEFLSGILVIIGIVYVTLMFTYEFCRYRYHRRISKYTLYKFSQINDFIAAIGIGTLLLFCIFSVLWIINTLIWYDEILM